MINISFIILEYNCLEEIGPCLSSIKGHVHGARGEWIVTSNSKYDRETRENLKKNHAEVRWIFNERNAGYAAAMNRGIEAASGEIVALLNADARLIAGLAGAVNYFAENENLAVLGPKIIDDQGNLQDSARPFMTPWLGMQRSLTRAFRREDVLLEKGFDYNEAQPVDWVSGAFMLAKRTAIEKVGMLDEKYFLYVEDMDWCRRFWEGGFEVHYFPELQVQFSGTRRSSAFLSGKGRVGRHTLIHLRSYLRYLRKFGCSGHRRETISHTA